MFSSSSFARTLPVVLLLVGMALSTRAVAQQPRSPQQGDVFSGGGPCREQPPFDCRCPVRQKGMLTVEHQRHHGRMQFLQGTLQRADGTLQRGLSQTHHHQERKNVHKTYNQEVKTWTEALKEEERLHTCRVGEIQHGCPAGWEQTCAPKPPGRPEAVYCPRPPDGDVYPRYGEDTQGTIPCGPAVPPKRGGERTKETSYCQGRVSWSERRVPRTLRTADGERVENISRDGQCHFRIEFDTRGRATAQIFAYYNRDTRVAVTGDPSIDDNANAELNITYGKAEPFAFDSVLRYEPTGDGAYDIAWNSPMISASATTNLIWVRRLGDAGRRFKDPPPSSGEAWAYCLGVRQFRVAHVPWIETKLRGVTLQGQYHYSRSIGSNDPPPPPAPVLVSDLQLGVHTASFHIEWDFRPFYKATSRRR